jgi:hypothetical protein
MPQIENLKIADSPRKKPMLNRTHSAWVNSWLKDGKITIPVEKKPIIPAPSRALFKVV